MEQNLLTKKKLKEKSIEYQIPFADLLEVFLQETLMFQILETDFAKRLWLKNREAFDLDSYRKEWQKPLHFVYGQDDGKEQQVLDEKRRSARNGNIISAGIILWKKRNRTIWFT